MKDILTDWTLVGSHSDLEKLCRLIEKKWYWTGVRAHKNDHANFYNVYAAGKYVDEVRIIKKGKRFRFERKVSGLI